MTDTGPGTIISKSAQPVGVVLAGGGGRRIGGQKATVALDGRPLIAYPLEAMRAVLREVAILAKPDTQLPDLPGVMVWIEPQRPRHPLVGIVEALSLAGGRPVLVCACDLPLVSPGLIRALAEADPQGAPAVVAAAGGTFQPLLACYGASALGALRAYRDTPHVRLTEAVASLLPRLLEVEPEVLFNVNTPDELLRASALLRNQPKVKS
jgi:molybdenum cofactor guanylyltransferase